jgi:hypothetical protein
MALQQRSRTITDVYRRQLGAVRTEAVALASRLWGGVDARAIDQTVPPVLASVGIVVTAAQALTSAMAGVYLEAYMTSELGEPVPRPVVDTATYAGRTRDGRLVAEPLSLTTIAMKGAVLAGATTAGVSLAGLARMTRVVRTETVSAARAAQGDLMGGDDRVDGYYRASAGEPCAACLGLAGVEFATDEVFPIHGACQCTAEPIMAGVADRFSPPNGKVLLAAMGAATAATLYQGRAAAVEDGDATLSDLVETRDSHQWGAVLFAAPASSIAPDQP